MLFMRNKNRAFEKALEMVFAAVLFLYSTLVPGVLQRRLGPTLPFLCALQTVLSILRQWK